MDSGEFCRAKFVSGHITSRFLTIYLWLFHCMTFARNDRETNENMGKTNNNKFPVNILIHLTPNGWVANGFWRKQTCYGTNKKGYLSAVSRNVPNRFFFFQEQKLRRTLIKLNVENGFLFSTLVLCVHFALNLFNSPHQMRNFSAFNTFFN